MKVGSFYHILTIYGERQLVQVRKVERKYITLFYHYNGKPVVSRIAKSDIVNFEIVTLEN